MDLGFQDKRKRYALIACLALLVLAALYAVKSMPKGGSTPAAPAAAPAQASAGGSSPQTAAEFQRRRRQESIDIYKIDPTIHLEKLEQAKSVDYTSTKRNLFRYEAPPPPPPPKKTAEEIKEEKLRAAQPPPPPPPPPPIDLKYYGFATDAVTKTKKVFLTNGQDIFIAKEGDIVGNRYKIVSIGVNSVEVEDLKNKNRQRLPLIES